MGRFISDETRRRLATGWDPRVSTLRQYAKDNGVSERAIRNWRARLRHDDGITVPGDSDAVPLRAVVVTLQERLTELEAAVDAARDAVAAARVALEACRPVTGGAGETSDDCHDGEQHATAAGAAPEAAEVQGHAAHDAHAVRPVPMPAPGFSWF